MAQALACGTADARVLDRTADSAASRARAEVRDHYSWSSSRQYTLGRQWRGLLMSPWPLGGVESLRQNLRRLEVRADAVQLPQEMLAEIRQRTSAASAGNRYVIPLQVRGIAGHLHSFREPPAGPRRARVLTRSVPCGWIFRLQIAAVLSSPSEVWQVCAR